MIGETADIGEDVTLYQGVTLGGTGFATGKRHPTVQDNVTIGSGAKLLGPITIGHGAKIGANSVVITDVPPNSTVVGNPGHPVRVDGRRVEGPDADWIHLPDPIAEAIQGLASRIGALERTVSELSGEEAERRSPRCARCARSRGRTRRGGRRGGPVLLAQPAGLRHRRLVQRSPFVADRPPRAERASRRRRRAPATRPRTAMLAWSGRSSTLTIAAITAISPNSTLHTPAATGSAGERSVSVAKNSTSAAIAASISSTTAGPNVLHALSLPSAFSYQGSVSATIRQTAPAAASSSPGGIGRRSPNG